MADDRRHLCESSSAWLRCSWRQSGHEPHKRGLNTKIHLAVDAHGLPIRFTVTQGTTADCSQALELIENLAIEHLMADKAYDTDDLVRYATDLDIGLVIPPKCNRVETRPFDRHLYRLRHLVENAFLKMKQWRGIASRYAKNTKSFIAALHIRCMMIWLSVL